MRFQSWFQNNDWGLSPCFVIQWTLENLWVCHSQLLPPIWWMLELPAHRDRGCWRILGCSVCEHGLGVLFSVWHLPTLQRMALHRVTINYATAELNNGGKEGTDWMSAWLCSVSMQTSATWQRKVSNNWEQPEVPHSAAWESRPDPLKNVNVLFTLFINSKRVLETRRDIYRRN